MQRRRTPTRSRLGGARGVRSLTWRAARGSLDALEPVSPPVCPLAPVARNHATSAWPETAALHALGDSKRAASATPSQCAAARCSGVKPSDPKAAGEPNKQSAPPSLNTMAHTAITPVFAARCNNERPPREQSDADATALPRGTTVSVAAARNKGNRRQSVAVQPSVTAAAAAAASTFTPACGRSAVPRTHTIRSAASRASTSLPAAAAAAQTSVTMASSAQSSSGRGAAASSAALPASVGAAASRRAQPSSTHASSTVSAPAGTRERADSGSVRPCKRQCSGPMRGSLLASGPADVSVTTAPLSAAKGASGGRRGAVGATSSLPRATISQCVPGACTLIAVCARKKSPAVPEAASRRANAASAPVAAALEINASIVRSTQPGRNVAVNAIGAPVVKAEAKAAGSPAGRVSGVACGSFTCSTAGAASVATSAARSIWFCGSPANACSGGCSGGTRLAKATGSSWKKSATSKPSLASPFSSANSPAAPAAAFCSGRKPSAARLAGAGATFSCAAWPSSSESSSSSRSLWLRMAAAARTAAARFEPR